MEEGLFKVDREGPETLAEGLDKRYRAQLKTQYMRRENLAKFTIWYVLYTLGNLQTTPRIFGEDVTHNPS
jgi:hypothetical protein